MAAPLVICYFPFLNTNAVSHHKETFIKWIFSKVICLCPKGLVNVKIYFELKKKLFPRTSFPVINDRLCGVIPFKNAYVAPK